MRRTSAAASVFAGGAFPQRRVIDPDDGPVRDQEFFCGWERNGPSGIVAIPLPSVMRSLRSLSGLLLLIAVTAFGSEAPLVRDNGQPGDFKLVADRKAPALLVDGSDFAVVHIAAHCLAADIQSVTGVQPEIALNPSATAHSLVIIGAIGHSTFIDALIRAHKLDVSGIRGKWESYLIATVSNPLPGVRTALVIAGSDRRGTAYGVFDLSETIGVSPWTWWEDVVPAHRDTLVIASGAHIHGPPSITYRGIFLNDEDWSLQPWAAKTYEPDTKDIGPKTYAKICELLLRMKANYLWPAMHPCTKAFNLYPQNKIVADQYAIVMGSSHAEPMLRDNVTEWTLPKEDYNYVTHRDDILKYWEQRLLENGSYENSYTLGIRGIHDSPMAGGGTEEQKVARLQQVIADQRALLARDVNPDLTQIPQIFTPYKEVLGLYQHGLKVPDDVTLNWPDDNHGYIRELSNPEEQRRAGGAGVYYHVSYYGAPEDYLWLCSTPPALIWEEMRKAYDYGARTVWVLNVGGLKKSAIDMDFFLRMAWDVDAWNENAQPVFLNSWAERNFGSAHAAEIATIMGEYFGLNYPSKPEHMMSAQFTSNYQEKQGRLQDFTELVGKTNALYRQLPAEKRDAFYEMVVYPVRCSALMNAKFLSDSPIAAQKAYDEIQEETKDYNEQIAGGKWNFIMSAAPRKRPVFGPPVATGTTPAPAPETSGSDGGYVSIDAAHATGKTGGPGVTWTAIQGLGRSGHAITLLPATAAIPDAAALTYRFSVPGAVTASVLVYCIPTHAVYPGMSLRYSASVDGDPPKIVDIDTVEFSKPWSINVLRGAAIGTTQHTIATPGSHTLTLHPLDPGVVFDKVVIDLGGLKPTQLGPPETSAR